MSAPAKKSHPSLKKTRRRKPTTPRPLALQRLAAELVATSHGLDHPERHHIGALCDAIARAGIDPQVWTANDLNNALNADMRQRGWSWPNEITKPAAFLASRLRLLPTLTSTNPADGGRAASPDQAQGTPGGDHDARVTAPSPASTANAPFTGPNPARDLSCRPTPAGASMTHAGACVVCGGTGAVCRPFLPAYRANVCDGCWDLHAEESSQLAKAGMR